MLYFLSFLQWVHITFIIRKHRKSKHWPYLWVKMVTYSFPSVDEDMEARGRLEPCGRQWGWAAYMIFVTVRAPVSDFQPFQGKPGQEVRSPLTAGKLLQLWSIREQFLLPLTFIKPPSPSSVSVHWGCLPGHSLIKSECPRVPETNRRSLWGRREKGGQGDRERTVRKEERRANVQRTLVCFAIMAINAGKWHFKGLWWQLWWHSCLWLHDKSLSVSYFAECGDSSEDGCLGMLSSCLLEALLLPALQSLGM